MKRLVGFSSVLGLCLWVLVSCIQLLVGQYYVLNAELAMDRSEQQLKPETNQELGSLKSYLTGVSRWDDLNPDSLLLIASHQAMQADKDNASFDDAIQTAHEAQLKRPLQARAFLMEAEYQWRNQANFAAVMAPLERAQKNAPFDQSVALLSLEFFLAHWTQLNIKQRVLLSEYLLEPKKFRLPRHKVEDVIARSPEKVRACRLLFFNQISMQTCRG